MFRTYLHNHNFFRYHQRLYLATKFSLCDSGVTTPSTVKDFPLLTLPLTKRITKTYPSLNGVLDTIKLYPRLYSITSYHEYGKFSFITKENKEKKVLVTRVNNSQHVRQLCSIFFILNVILPLFLSTT